MGPLNGVMVVEMGGIGPGPMCAMLLAEMGATVLRIERKVPAKVGLARPRKLDLLLRSRGSVAVDLKSPAGVEFLLKLVARADGLIESFRPGVMERLGLGPEPCMARNAKLVYGRMTGWGQTGPLAQAAAHDLNYVALTGVVHANGQAGQAPNVPMNVIGDFGGGALYLAMGLLAGIIEARTSGKGQVVDAAIVDGVTSLQTYFWGMRAAGLWSDTRGANSIDGGSHFCQVYACADGEYVSIAAVEDQFYAELLRRMEVNPAAIGNHMDRNNWARGREVLAARFKTKTRNEWCSLLEGADCCFAPVLSRAEAPAHPHMRARGNFVEVDGVVQPAPAPKFSRTPGMTPTAPEEITPANADRALAAWIEPAEIAALRAAGTIL